MDEDDQGGLRRRGRIGDEHTSAAARSRGDLEAREGGARVERTAERTRNSREAAKSEIGRRRRRAARQLKKRQDLEREEGSDIECQW